MTTGFLINGEASEGVIPVTDSSVLRGDGCFEVIRSYDGKAFAVDEHLDRLRSSSAALGIGLPTRADLRKWVGAAAGQCGDCLIRVIVTRGSAVPGLSDPSRVIVFAHDVPDVGGDLRLLPVESPWHAAGVDWELAGAKILSYAPNLASGRRAQAEGFDDALLVTTEGTILEGPTFTVAWMCGGVLETPTLDLGILDSITRRVVLEEAQRVGLEVVEDVWPYDRLAASTEMMALSTVREVQPVTQVSDMTLEPGPVTIRLAKAFATMVR